MGHALKAIKILKKVHVDAAATPAANRTPACH